MTDQITIRRSRPEDATELAEMWWAMKMLDAGYDPRYYGLRDRDFCIRLRTQQFREGVNIPGIVTFVAEVSGIVAGYVLCGVEDRLKVCAIEKRIGIGGVYVKPKYRRHGVGRVLFDAVSAFAQQHNVKLVELTVDSKNDALAFYKAIGFSERMHTVVRWTSEKEP